MRSARAKRRREGTYEDNAVFLLAIVVMFLPLFHAYRGRPPRATRAPRQIKVCLCCSSRGGGVLWFHSRKYYLRGWGSRGVHSRIPSPSPEEHDEPEGKIQKEGKRALVNPARANGPSHPFPIPITAIPDRKRRGEVLCGCVSQPELSLISIAHHRFILGRSG